MKNLNQEQKDANNPSGTDLSIFSAKPDDFENLIQSKDKKILPLESASELGVAKWKEMIPYIARPIR